MKISEVAYVNRCTDLELLNGFKLSSVEHKGFAYRKTYISGIIKSLECLIKKQTSNININWYTCFCSKFFFKTRILNILQALPPSLEEN